MTSNPKVNKFKFAWSLNDKGPVKYRNNAGLLHRENGPAVEYEDGTVCWYNNGKRHRIDGPAIEWPNGDKEWYVDDKRHRLDGPAWEYVDGTKEWFIDGKLVTETECNILFGIMRLKGLL